MNRIFYIIPVVITLLIIQSCQTGDHEPVNKTTSELVFLPTVTSHDSDKTRAIGDDFFQTGGAIDVNITSSKGSTQLYRYVYGADHLFKGDPPYHFSLDDSYITNMTAYWPAAAVRQQGLITDQRVLEDYKSSDWMTASASVEGIIPTDAPVPLNFQRENAMLEFELVGQNTEGLDIETLILELHNDNQPLAYWAYCGNPNGHAELILAPGTTIFSEDNYLIGRVQVSQQNEYTIIFPKTDLVLQPGTRYLVTLTPQGYFMNAYVFLGGWSEGEDGIGIPFQQPTPDLNGEFNINTPVQLISMSYLTRHYNDGSTFDWRSRTYRLADDFAMTQEYASQYIPIDSASFTGQILQNDIPVRSIAYGDSLMLNLFNVNE